MLSIRPEWCEKIARRKKTIEVRKNRPKLETPFKCYIYCTKATQMQSDNWFLGYADELCFDKNGKIKFGFIRPELWPVVGMNGKVIGEFVCDDIEKVAMDSKYDFLAMISMSDRSCVSLPVLEDYANGEYYLYGWHISDLVIYDKPKELSDFMKYSDDYDRPCEKGSCCENEYFDYSENCKACHIDFDGTNCPKMKLQRPPQSWCYVEEVQDETAG